MYSVNWYINCFLRVIAIESAVAYNFSISHSFNLWSRFRRMLEAWNIDKGHSMCSNKLICSRCRMQPTSKHILKQHTYTKPKLDYWHSILRIGMEYINSRVLCLQFFYRGWSYNYNGGGQYVI